MKIGHFGSSLETQRLWIPAFAGMTGAKQKFFNSLLGRVADAQIGQFAV